MKAQTSISKTGLAALVTGFMFVTAIASPAAVTITYVGNQVDIEDDANTPTEGWRNPTPTKPLDIDGDHILGTDGYSIGTLISNPTYATITRPAPNVNGNAAWGLWDHPTNPSGNDTLAATMLHHNGIAQGVESNPLLQFVINGNDLDGQILRLGILYDVIVPRTGLTYTLTQTVGGSATMTTPAFDTNGTSLDVAFFDIIGAVDGDTFVVTATNTGGSGGGHELAGITFDTALIPEPSTALLSGLGFLALLLRRRR